MFKTKNPTVLYRRFLSDALRLSWSRKRLWVFGLFAAMISTGGIFDIVAASMKKIRTTGSLLDGLAHGSFSGYEIAGAYIHKLALMNHERITATVTALTIIFVFLVIAATVSQGGLILGLKAIKPRHLISLKIEASKHFFPLLTIAILNKLSNAIAVLVMSLPLFSFFLITSSNSVFLFLALSLVLIPSLVVINSLYQFTMLGIVDNGLGVHEAFTRAAKLFSKHWLSTLEFGLLLFAATFGFFLILISLLALLMVPYAMVFTAALVSGIPWVFFVCNIAFCFLLLLIALAYLGFVVTFQYSAWYGFYKHGIHPIRGRKLFSKIFRLIHG
jgi:hypothetical protein